MARTMTVDVGDELHEKQAESRLQELRDLLAEGISSGEAKPVPYTHPTLPTICSG